MDPYARRKLSIEDEKRLSEVQARIDTLLAPITYDISRQRSAAGLSDFENPADEEEYKRLIKERYSLLYVSGGGSRKSLDKCTIDELKARAAKRKIKVTGLKKAEILAKLRK